MNRNSWRKLTIALLFFTSLCLPSCLNHPSDAQLTTWREEAISRNAELVASYGQQAANSDWNLLIQGQTATGKPLELNWQQVRTGATANVKTNDPNYVIKPNKIFNFRGILVSKLLKSISNIPDVKTVTFISFDGYQVTVSLEDLLAYPITLAIERDNQPLARDQGGPIYLIFPYNQYPELKQKYTSGDWAFYVTNIIVGTEPVQLTLGKRQLDLATLDKLPQVTLFQPVDYRIGWPSGKVKLQGVRLRDVLALAGEQLPESGVVLVQGKAPIYRDTNNPIRLSAKTLRECDVILATRWGEDKQPIPAKMGGPLTLAFGDNCHTKVSDQRWVTFVEQLSVAP
ncbi:MAG: molybdopterin-dependent oxidoreductase [Nostocaceae cyanobacterium]|nr:molybdopterin-dependent oxidoreductase [Nostocaceae cyanobacterium]